MNLLQTERATLERAMPGLDQCLAGMPLEQLESSQSPVLHWYREAGGAGLLIGKGYGGAQLGALEVVRIQRALGSRCPSLALAANMHTCTVAAIPPCDATEHLLRSIASERLLMASGFAEGQPSTSIQSPGIVVRAEPEGLVLNGSKKPCSLALSMDLFTASVIVPQPDGTRRFALVTIPATISGLSRRPFGLPGLLDAAENQEVVLEDVRVPREYVSYFGEAMTLTQELSGAFLWFELFVSASYLGAASALVERLYTRERGAPATRTQLATQLQVSMLSLEAIASRIDQGIRDQQTVVCALMARFAIQGIAMDVASEAAEQLGGIQYLREFDVPYLLRVTRALAFHPPAKRIMDEPIDAYLYGGELRIP
ncbi:acyl-CoA dehydrogenase family protein [Cupriavidus basilensis]|uniref:acyl-CoA dehydrogenase family protein n=1 Tax=Cupriavidus basilensis TaxID=68895 RepID=UPI0020A6D8F0|nr:acyl-CoA dehydrogenase family protein [Cupriavidus basilensis]MCP3023502.1 acyl-CoA/acyl-ACP dehydrogenase [Cupriavidus basilensis]